MKIYNTYNIYIFNDKYYLAQGYTIIRIKTYYVFHILYEFKWCIYIIYYTDSIIHDNILFTERFSCAYINRYGFRYCLFIGSILSITWFILLCFIENVFVHEYLFLAIVGGGKCRKHSRYINVSSFIYVDNKLYKFDNL